jgi:soluble lytic murein transglycosylase-like protein
MLMVSTCYGSAEEHKFFLYKAVGTYLNPNHDEARIAGQIHQESSWNEHAHNPSGATGLGQFIPSTARWMHQRYGSELGAYSKYSARWSILATVLYKRDLIRGDGDACYRWRRGLKNYSGGARHYAEKIFSHERRYISQGWRGIPVCG